MQEHVHPLRQWATAVSPEYQVLDRLTVGHFQKSYPPNQICYRTMYIVYMLFKQLPSRPFYPASYTHVHSVAQPRHTHLIQVEFWNEDWRCGSCKRWSWELCPNLGKVFILNFCLPFQDEDVERLWWSENSVAQYLWCPFQGRPFNSWRFYNIQRRLLITIRCKNSPKKIRVRHMLIFYFGSQNTGQFKGQMRGHPSTNLWFPRKIHF